jgi:hypothetical protein
MIGLCKMLNVRFLIKKTLFFYRTVGPSIHIFLPDLLIFYRSGPTVRRSFGKTVASAILKRDIFCVNLCVYFIYFFCSELFRKWYLIIFLKRNNCFMVSGLQRSPVSKDLLLYWSIIVNFIPGTNVYLSPQTMLKIVKWNIFISLKMFAAGNHFTCYIIGMDFLVWSC